MNYPESPTSAEYPEMAYMLGYYHGNWVDEPRYIENGRASADRVVAWFLRDERPATVAAAREELGQYLKVERSEPELKRMLNEIYANIRPAAFGMTIRQWLEHVQALLAEHA